MVRQYVYFQVTGCGTPEPVTEALGVQPSDCHSDSDLNPRTGDPWRFMKWRLDSGESQDAPVHQHVDALLLWLNRRPTAVKSLADDYDLTLCIACWTNDTFGLHITRDQIRLLGSLGIAIDYDGYVTAETNSVEAPNPDEP